MGKKQYPEFVECAECDEVYLAFRGREKPYCPDCRHDRVFQAVHQLKNRRGPIYNKWKIRHNEGRLRWARELLLKEHPIDTDKERG